MDAELRALIRDEDDNEIKCRLAAAYAAGKHKGKVAAQVAMDPQTQAENLEYMKLFAITLGLTGLDEVLLSERDVNRVNGMVVVIGPNPDDRSIRVRLMTAEDAEKESAKVRRGSCP
jgi:hypothetical protein